ncbi:hypothetical protein KVV02_008768 [Mortierella alpina]|uniref:FAD-binding domain-containing protein n=1 Tax=Mortierella alpina TaxID=64518 RepID=A0A9P8CUG5_MORAP|nr:hypothetical protein KVV02_008768 [Mortierella alpina]
MTLTNYFCATDSAGYPALVFARPELYDLLISKIPPEKIFMNKKILSMEQNALGVMIRCHDGSNHHGDILVGADGAYSGVRQGLYKNLAKKKLLPKTDSEDLELGYIVMVGVTDPLDENKYPELKDTHTHFRQVLGDKCIALAIRCCHKQVKKLSERIFRNMMFNYMPAFLRVRHYAKAASYQPQASFLPTIPPRGTGPVEPQMQSKRYRKELEKKKAGALLETVESNETVPVQSQ